MGNWLALPGRLFLVSIQMIVVPLVFASIIRGLSGGQDMVALKRLGLWATGIFLAATAIAAASWRVHLCPHVPHATLPPAVGRPAECRPWRSCPQLTGVLVKFGVGLGLPDVAAAEGIPLGAFQAVSSVTVKS